MATHPLSEPVLSPAQQAAREQARVRARAARSAALARIAAVLTRAAVAADAEELIEGALRRPIALQFHPDRIAADGHPVAGGLLRHARYRSQFETGISNGSLTAVPGGDRDRWEQALWGGAYRASAPSERPVYGGLNIADHPDGPCPRFGSCHLRLRPAVARRATFCLGDSYAAPPDRGTADAFWAVLAGLLETAEAHGVVLGRPVSVPELVAELRRPPAPPGARRPNGRTLDDYVEVQVHGPVRFDADVAGVVADPSFQGTAVGRQLQELAARFDLELAWHEGFELDAGEVPAAFRGPAIPALAARIARHHGGGSSRLNAERVGAAARTVVTAPEEWADWGPPAVALQHLKQLWHVLVRYGRPAPP